eukprot:893554-Pelagomonas_calceolata.AAC.1
MSGMCTKRKEKSTQARRTNRHHVGLSFCVTALSKGRFGSSLITMDACRNERLLDQGIQVPEIISRAIPDW